MLKSIATVGGFTTASRVLGFLRDILIAHMLGTGFEADAFFVALRIPNLFRRLLAEGAFNAAFIPLHTRAAGEGRASGAQRFAEDTLALMITTLLAITLAALLAMPWLIALIAPGFLGTEAKFAAAVRFTRLTCPYLLLMGMVSVYAGVLNARRRFAHVAAAPLLFNFIMIHALIAGGPVTG